MIKECPQRPGKQTDLNKPGFDADIKACPDNQCQYRQSPETPMKKQKEIRHVVTLRYHYFV